MKLKDMQTFRKPLKSVIRRRERKQALTTLEGTIAFMNAMNAAYEKDRTEILTY